VGEVERKRDGKALQEGKGEATSTPACESVGHGIGNRRTIRMDHGMIM
jgi:hypothetical protein